MLEELYSKNILDSVDIKYINKLINNIKIYRGVEEITSKDFGIAEKILTNEIKFMEENFEKTLDGFKYEKKKLETLKMFISLLEEIEIKTTDNIPYNLRNTKQSFNKLKEKLKSLLSYIENDFAIENIKIKKKKLRIFN